MLFLHMGFRREWGTSFSSQRLIEKIHALSFMSKNNTGFSFKIIYTQKKENKKLTVKVTAQLSLSFPVFVEALGLQLLPVELVFLLDLQVAVQLRLTHRCQGHLWGRQAGQSNHTQEDGERWRWDRAGLHSDNKCEEGDTQQARLLGRKFRCVFEPHAAR